MTLTIDGLIFEAFGAITLIYSIFLKKKNNFINEASYYNEMILSNGESKELNPDILENSVTIWKNSFSGMIFFVIGFILQICGQLHSCNQYIIKIKFYYQFFLFLIVPIIYFLFRYIKKKKMRNLLLDFHKKNRLSLGNERTEVVKFFLKYFPEKKDSYIEYLNSFFTEN